MKMSGRSALVTGASGALGRIFSETLAEMGFDLLLVDREEIALNNLAEGLMGSWGVNVELFACDLENSDARSALIEVIKGRSSLDVLVNNAAFVGDSNLEGWATPFEQQSLDTWRRALEVNLTAPFSLAQGLTPLLSRSPGASIVNIGSIYGFLGPDWGLYEGTSMSNPAAYASSKGGLIQLTRWLSTTLGPKIRVNCISPGGIARGQAVKFTNRYIARTPLGRMATEDDFRGAIAYFASDLSRYVTGQNLFVDGGWCVW
ncbi:SDR family oxidoreductase [Polynucleobacter paneuropaeus]|nr:SDR family oxidoreductase [Polynucleobacter paneuropaeus]